MIYARDLSGIELKATHVKGNIYMLEGANGFAGGNIGVSTGDDGILIVDDQFTGMSDKILKTLSNIHTGKLRYVLNTHWHGDHTGSNALFSNQATIISHDNVRKRLMVDQNNFFASSPAQPEAAWPVITFNHSLNIHFNNETIKVLHFPNGHTDGDSVVYFTKSNVVHMGDLFFSGMFPFIDMDSGGNVINYAENIGNIIKSLSKGVKIIPGHGPLSDRHDLIVYHKMLKDSIQYVSEKIEKNIDLEDIQQQGLPENLKSWEKGFIKESDWIMFIYKSIINRR